MQSHHFLNKTNMKKTLFLTLPVMLCLAMALTACGGNDEPESSVAATATYQIDFSEDLLTVADVSIVYKDNNGQNNIDKLAIGSTQWLKKVSTNIKNDKTPAEFGFKLVYSLKTDELTKDNYDLTVESKISASTPSSSRTFEQTLLSGSSVKKGNVGSTVERGNNKTLGITVTKNGDIQLNPKFVVSI